VAPAPSKTFSDHLPRQTSGEHEFDSFKAQCFRFLTTYPVKDARDQLADLKQIKSAKAYTSIFRTEALNVTDLSPAESHDRYLRGLTKHVRAQVLQQRPAKTEDARRLAEIYDPLVLASRRRNTTRSLEQNSHEPHKP